MEEYKTIESTKSKNIALWLCIFGGYAGLHQYYVGNIGKGLLYTFTIGLLGIGWAIDIIKIMMGKFEDSEGLILVEHSTMTKEEAMIERNKWKKIAHSFFISEEYKKLKINNKDIDFSSLIDVELLEDNEIISKTTGIERKHVAPIKGAIGYGLFGATGAIIGGTAGKTKINTTTESNNYCTDLSVKITTNNINEPMIIYKLIEDNTDKDSYLYKKLYEDAHKCVSVIKAIINNNTINL